MVQIAITDIEFDGGTQPRAAIHPEWIKEYAEDMVSGAKFPPVVLFFDGASYWLADGFHRTHAAEASGATSIDADVRQGTQRDAILFSVSANASHGQRRTNDDKRRAVLCLLNDPEWSGWSNREIARRCGVDDKTVAGIRPPPPIAQNLTAEIRSDTRSYTTKHGTEAVMNTANIGRRPTPPALPPLTQAPRVEPSEPAHYERAPRGTETTIPEPAGVGDLSTPPVPTDRTEPEARPAPRPVVQFDHDAAAVRNKAMDAIRALASQPAPEVVLAAWMKHGGYGEPVALIETAIEWLAAFLPLYQEAEPRRWADCQERLKRVA